MGDLAVLLEARLLGNALRRDVVCVGTQLEPLAAQLLK